MKDILNNKICLINQPCGLGDILFSQKIVYHYINLGYEVIIPVVDEYIWLKDYIKNVTFISINNNFYGKEYYNGTNKIETDNFVYIPLNIADRVFPFNKIMEAKYKMVNIDYTDWSNYLVFERNKEKEDELYYNILGLKDDEKYVLISNNYGTPPNYLKYPIDIKNINDKIIYLDFIQNFNLFDWCKVIENCRNLYTIDSSINFIIEKLNMKAENMFLYTRRKNNFSEINFLFNKKYHYIYD